MFHGIYRQAARSPLGRHAQDPALVRLGGVAQPLRRTDAGYRLYGPQEVDRLQILFYRELGLELSAIRRLLDDPAFDREAALQSHSLPWEARRTPLDALILTVKKRL